MAQDFGEAAMSESEKIEFLGGQVTALMHMVGVLFKIVPDREALQKQYATTKQIGLAKIEAQLVPDVYIDGMHEIYQQMEKLISSAPERR
jgi:hypothetical protein